MPFLSDLFAIQGDNVALVVHTPPLKVFKVLLGSNIGRGEEEWEKCYRRYNT